MAPTTASIVTKILQLVLILLPPFEHSCAGLAVPRLCVLSSLRFHRRDTRQDRSCERYSTRQPTSVEFVGLPVSAGWHALSQARRLPAAALTQEPPVAGGRVLAPALLEELPNGVPRLLQREPGGWSDPRWLCHIPPFGRPHRIGRDARGRLKERPAKRRGEVGPGSAYEPFWFCVCAEGPRNRSPRYAPLELPLRSLGGRPLQQENGHAIT